MTWIQTELQLKPRSRGFHLVTDEILTQLPELQPLRVGLLHLFIMMVRAAV